MITWENLITDTGKIVHKPRRQNLLYLGDLYMSLSIIKSWKLFFKEYFVVFLQVCPVRFDTGGRKGDWVLR